MMNGRFLKISVSFIVIALLVGCGTKGKKKALKQSKMDEPAKLKVEQDWGKTVYWVETGERELSEEVFGTPENPEFTTDQMVKEAKSGVAEFPEGAPGPVIQLIKDLPILVAAPTEHRETNDDGTKFTQYNHPVPFTDGGVPLGFSKKKNGYFEATLIDRVKSDLPGGPGNTHDKVNFETVFHDPEGNKYRVEIDHLVQPPLPRYETGNGVILDRYIHGKTGTGTPLMPRQYSHGAFWSMGKIYVNGEYRGKRLTHLMTTQVVRNRDYDLAADEELPLGEDKRHIGNQAHHTHLMIAPVEPYKPLPVLGSWFGLGPTAPRKSAVPTEHKLDNGKKQPVIHVMFEQDEITKSQNVDLNENFM